MVTSHLQLECNKRDRVMAASRAAKYPDRMIFSFKPLCSHVPTLSLCFHLQVSYFHCIQFHRSFKIPQIQRQSKMWICRALAALTGLAATTLAQGSAGGDQSRCSASQGWVSQGCYDDTNNGVHAGFTWRLSPVAGNEKYYPGFTGSMSVDICLQACRGDGFRYAALYAGANCYCGSIFPNPAPPSSGITTSGLGVALGKAPGTPGGLCDMRCNGNDAQICGGTTSVNLYVDPSFTNSSAAQISSNYLYIGCYSYVDPGPMFIKINTVNTSSCETYCGLLGYSYSARTGIDSNTGAKTCGCGTEIQSGFELTSNLCLFYCNGTVGAP